MACFRARFQDTGGVQSCVPGDWQKELSRQRKCFMIRSVQWDSHWPHGAAAHLLPWPERLRTRILNITPFESK